MKLALVGGTLIDGTGQAPLPGATVIIEDGMILGVTAGRDLGSEVHEVDVAGKTVMPGLIDCHVHFAPWFQFLITEQKTTIMYQAARAVDCLRSLLECGVTSARDLGGLEAGFRDAVDHGLILGPRLKVCLTVLQATNAFEIVPGVGGLITVQELYTRLPGVPANFCDGPDQCRAKVRECLRYGADFIKIMNDGFPQKRLRVDRSPFTHEEMNALVDEAHRAGVPISAHAYRPNQVMDVLRAGVDSIEEGYFLDQECVDEMARRGVWYVPCMMNPIRQAAESDDLDCSGYSKQCVDAGRKSFQMALEAGVPIACGTDGAFSSVDVSLELQAMADAGMPVADAIAAATSKAADFLRVEDEVGRIKPGLKADLLVVDGNPLEDISVLQDIERIQLVMQGGNGISGQLVQLLPKSPSRYPRMFVS